MTRREAEPVSAEEAARFFAPLEAARGLVIAVSGGPDSLALLLLMAEWKPAGRRPPLFAVTVDHRLRPEAAAEAAAVADLCADLRIDHRTLVWGGEKPATGLAGAARLARYRLLRTAVKSSRSTHLVTAHHADDQAETVLMRLAGGSGIDGLAAMRAWSDFGDGLTLARPLLAISKERLVASCLARGLVPFDDPGNHDPARPRPRLRQAAAILAREGLTPARLGTLARRSARACDALQSMTRHALGEAMVPGGLDWALLARSPEEIRIRALLSLFSEPAPRLEQVETLLEKIDAAFGAGKGCRVTLAGQLLSLSQRAVLSVTVAPERSASRA
jgi:tRNA(Ile)-lysidine synthase